MVLLMERQTRTRKTSNKRQRIRLIRPSSVPKGGIFPSFLDEIEFGALGKLNEAAVHQPKPAATNEIVRWMAVQDQSLPFDALMKKVVAERPAWFTPRASLDLFEKSLRLPRGELVVSFIKDPVVLQDNPPPSVLARWDRALTEFSTATTYYIEPIFDRPIDENGVALTLAELKKTVDRQWAGIRRKLWWSGAGIRRQEARAKEAEERFMRRLEMDASEMEIQALASGDRFNATARMRSLADVRRCGNRLRDRCCPAASLGLLSLWGS